MSNMSLYSTSKHLCCMFCSRHPRQAMKGDRRKVGFLLCMNFMCDCNCAFCSDARDPRRFLLSYIRTTTDQHFAELYQIWRLGRRHTVGARRSEATGKFQCCLKPPHRASIHAIVGRANLKVSRKTKAKNMTSSMAFCAQVEWQCAASFSLKLIDVAIVGESVGVAFDECIVELKNLVRRFLHDVRMLTDKEVGLLFPSQIYGIS